MTKITKSLEPATLTHYAKEGDSTNTTGIPGQMPRMNVAPVPLTPDPGFKKKQKVYADGKAWKITSKSPAQGCYYLTPWGSNGTVEQEFHYSQISSVYRSR